EFWKEAFLHPKQSHGIVVQLAQSAPHDHVAQFDLPPPRITGPSSLVRIVHLVADLDGALGLFEQTLGGVRGQTTDDSVELACPKTRTTCSASSRARAVASKARRSSNRTVAPSPPRHSSTRHSSSVTRRCLSVRSSSSQPRRNTSTAATSARSCTGATSAHDC